MTKSRLEVSQLRALGHEVFTRRVQGQPTIGGMISSVARRANTSITFTNPLKDMLTIRTHGNTDFMNIMVKKTFYQQLEEKAKRFETTPDALIYNTLLLIFAYQASQSIQLRKPSFKA